MCKALVGLLGDVAAAGPEDPEIAQLHDCVAAGGDGVLAASPEEAEVTVGVLDEQDFA